MKKLKYVFITFLGIIYLIGLNNSVFANVDESTIKIKTEFHCNGGKTKIESEISKIDGVISVVADLETKIVTIKYDSAKLNKDKLVEAIEKTGHKTEFTKEGTKIKSDCGSHGVGDKKCDTPK
jgi:copper chaperone CopZ